MFVNRAFAGMIPLAGTEVAVRWDNLYYFLIILSIFFFVLIVGGMLYFLVAYKHQPNTKTQYITDNHWVEAIWVAIPTFLLLVIFGWGYSVYHSMTQAPADAYEIRVIGKQWLWTFQYDDGRTLVGEVYVPINRPVKLIMTSEDVLHSFFIPTFRVKQDVVPGMYSSVWFRATVPGKHQVFCTEYCGTSHSQMLAKVIVLDDQQWDAWSNHKKIGEVPDAREEDEDQAQEEGSATKDSLKTSSSGLIKQVSLAEQGRMVHEKKGCRACHMEDGTNHIGPSHKGLFGSQVELTDGRRILADENYIRNHIENPRANTVKGYSGAIMPTFKGLISESEMNALIAYIKSLR